jgi:hypothetical protein
MLTSYFNITVIAEWLALTASLFFLNKKTGIWRYFTPFLALTITVETTGWYTHYFLNKSNNWIFNILLIISVSFFLWIFTYAEPIKAKRKTFYIIIAFFTAIAFMNLAFFEGFGMYDLYTEVLGDIILAIVSCYFLFTILKEEEYRNLFRYEYFWLANGLLFYSLSSTVLYLFLNELRTFTKETGIAIYIYLNGGLNVLFYSSLSIAFICKYRATKLLQVL